MIKIGVTLRNMGHQSSRDVFLGGARAADERHIESLWVTDHIAIPPEDAQGSDGRYLDPLISLGVIAGVTEQIRLGTGVLILPYRPALPTAKQIATLQELSAGRLLLGAGIGWMDPEFRALGLDRHQRGSMADSVLEFLHRCFDNEVVTANGQQFLFKPRPERPPIYVGGRAPHALIRALRYGDGWLPMGGDPEQLSHDLAEYDRLAAELGSARGRVTVMRQLPLTERRECQDLIGRYTELGVERIVCAVPYETLNDYTQALDRLAEYI